MLTGFLVPGLTRGLSCVQLINQGQGFAMIKTKIITARKLLKIYQEIYILLAKNQVDLEYFEQSKVRIFYKDSEEKMLGGFCINSGPDYRTFLPLNSNQLKKLKKENGFDEIAPHEITCLWIEEKSRRALWIMYFFFFMMKDIFLLPKGNFIFGTHEKNINNYFKFCFPKIIFF